MGDQTQAYDIFQTPLSSGYPLPLKERTRKEQTLAHEMPGEQAKICNEYHGCGSGSAWIRINLSCSIQIQEGKNDPQKKLKNFHVLKCWMFSFLRADGFSFSLCVLYGGLRISKVKFSIQKIKKKFYICKTFSIFGHQNPGFGTGSGSGSAIRKNAGSRSALNQCGSTTLKNTGI
jgi:hypothetical protein